MQENTANPFGYVINAGLSGIWMTLVLGFSSCFALDSCDTARRQPIHNGTTQPILSASPNPVPTGDPDKPVASTQITWDTGNGKIGELYVKIDREDERLVSHAPSGSTKIDWIQFDSVYEFRLYGKKHSKLLATLTVTRDD